MANLSAIIDTDPTLDAVNKELEISAQQKKRKPPAIPISLLGDPCERKLWLHFRMAKTESFSAEQLRRFEDGYRSEDVEASRLARVPGIQLRTIDPVTGYQYSVSAADGHLQGRLDGRVIGLLQAPATEHVWESKCVNEKKQTALLKAKQEHGEKQALQHWDTLYYAQAVLYMHLTDLTRHYLTCTTPGSLWTISVRTDADNDHAERLLEKAQRIKDAQSLPTGISDNPAWYQCKTCQFSGLCHQKQVADVNCRTCCHATAIADGEWHCAKFNGIVPKNFQMTGCDQHLFLPSLIPYAKTIDANQDENWIEYQTVDGVVFRNGKQKPAYTSRELSAAANYRAVGESNVEQLRSQFDATLI